MKKKIINNLILSVYLFSLMGCTCGMRMWELEITNELSYPIYVDMTIRRKYELGLMQPGESTIEVELVSQSVSPKASKKIRRISIFSEDREPIIILQGGTIDEYVIFMGKDKYNDYIFRLEVTEELRGIGLDNLNKKLEFEEELENGYFEDEFFEEEFYENEQEDIE